MHMFAACNINGIKQDSFMLLEMTVIRYKSWLPLYLQASTFLPVVQNQPDEAKRPKDNFGFAFCSLFINPLFGLVAIVLARM